MTTIHASTDRDFLGLLPSMIGYTPVESVVVVPFRDTRSAGVIRFDIPPAGEPLAPFEHTISDMLGRVEGITAAVVVIYTAAPYGTTLWLLEAMEQMMLRAAVDVRDLLYVAGDGYGSLKAGTGPNPVADILPHPDAPTFAVGDQLAGTELPQLSMMLLLEVSGALSTFEPEYLSDITLLNEALLEIPPADLDGEQIVYMAYAMHTPSVRDILLVQWCRDQATGEQALAAQLEWEVTDVYPTELAENMWGKGPRPDVARLTAGLELARIAAAAVESAGALSVAAWLSWALGRSSHASHYAEAGLEIEPEHGLCQIVAGFVQAGHLPDWAFLAKD